ncbi:Putative ribonuclease H protein At1g65750 [Linum perenne]
MKVWPHVTDGIQWSINNGKNTHFWTDRWVDSGIVLIDHAINISGVNPNLRVADVCSVEGEWNLNFLLTNLPYETVMQVWEAVLPEAVRMMAILRDFFTWWKCMLTDEERGIKFGITTWLLWKARNKLIFDKEEQSVSAITEQCVYWTNLVLSSWKTNQLGREAPSIARHAQLIAWRPGEEGWSTLNTDGSRFSRKGATAIGGLIRNEHDIFVQAFCANIGNCSITRAEIKAIVEGMKMAWSLGIRKLNIQSDSRVEIGILSSDPSISHQHRALVAEFHDYQNREWEVSLSHVYREANFAAD